MSCDDFPTNQLNMKKPMTPIPSNPRATGGAIINSIKNTMIAVMLLFDYTVGDREVKSRHGRTRPRCFECGCLSTTPYSLTVSNQRQAYDYPVHHVVQESRLRHERPHTVWSAECCPQHQANEFCNLSIRREACRFAHLFSLWLKQKSPARKASEWFLFTTRLTGYESIVANLV